MRSTNRGGSLPSLAKDVLATLWAHLPQPLRSRIIWLWSPKFIVSVNGVCLNSSEQMLILKQRFPNEYVWNLPGGIIRSGEHPEAGLRREIREETGLDAAISTLLFVIVNGPHLHLCYLCHVPDEEVVIQNSEILSYEWSDLRAADPRMADCRQAALRALDVAKEVRNTTPVR